jgi:hypothetical protein
VRLFRGVTGRLLARSVEIHGGVRNFPNCLPQRRGVALCVSGPNRWRTTTVMAPKIEGPGIGPPAGNPFASDPVQTLRDAARESQQLKQAIEQAQAGERTPVLRDPADRRRVPRKI